MHIDLYAFRRAMALRLGETLTPEVAAEIEARSRASTPDESIDPARFGEQDYKGAIIRAERLRDVLDELKPLHALHWNETESHRHGLPLDPDYDVMLERERRGALVQFVVRREGAIVAHLRMYLGRSLHSRTLFAEEDTLFVHPEHRGSLLVMALMRFAETALRALGVREIRADSKLVNRAHVLMERLGYEPVALKFVKVFEE